MNPREWIYALKSYGVLIIIGAVGLFILLYGFWSVVRPTPAVVEIIKGEEQVLDEVGKKSELLVDVAGEVINPGLYHMPPDARIGDALVVAGGLSAGADRDWVSRYVNLAEVVKDGGKIYIPAHQQVGESANQLTSGSASQTLGVATQGKVNINTASQSELVGLWGIGEARARTITAQRPYTSIEELKSKAKLPQNVFDTIKDQVSVY